ncbi:Enoyl-[acyl-carrier-protein] reductase [NADH] [Streptoalloteichus tenebrarius]|uniref:Enoyl-[acyl-carrier-protein] reductase [NADH] n=1 Tax=Streptoalloteichus tenebrarius (strain ATCC 17920 / DSM 40477 / JCM 4838 / CBS 697.72 / NBRC 16177 / NCIMB 11028 / NRRL B-12390 / A12253. 1 / ISP 5477) TaxID=1933 RepID=A0ABT1HR44_STRSD|nr:enoyl-ACP reductase FabI [Streptoalloteichus tenebrarius]MCP2257915.1 Enoyl-[acyl-carrier-protein] reductase [NADH] [Streptoalloteichus tenebrarius]BFE99720.1 enoyl-ACP reductase FabI [Streptoalloteichus tenebrarius]
MTGLLEGKRLLITGVITDASIGFHVARLAQEQGAKVVLTGYGRLSLVERIARRLPEEAPLIELDVTNDEHLRTLPERVGAHVDGLDGVLHSIGFAPPSCLGNPFLDAPWEDVSTALHVSAYSFKSLATACLPLMKEGGSLVGMDFDARVAWPSYNWMGVAKATLEATTRYLARELGPQGIRVNLVAAGPVRTMAAKSIPGFADLESAWGERAPLGWDVTTAAEPVARACCALLSDWFPATTGSMVWVDGGVHALGM